MKKFVETYWKTLLFFVVTGLLGGFFVGIYLLDSYPVPIRQQLLDSLAVSGLQTIPAELLLGMISALQAAGYGLVLGAFGIVLGRKTGLWKDETAITKKPGLVTLAVSVAGGLAMILLDVLLFGPGCQAIGDSYGTKPTIAYIVASAVYGAVTEEIMLRLFAMSLFAFLLHRLSGRRQEKPTTGMLIAANVVTAFLFATGHLPATFLILGNSPVILLRCFLLNGGMGLLFGYLYRKYGLRYAMLAHGGCHMVSKLIWILFL